MDFNPAPSTIMHLDINSCFASIEQQANPLLRHKPIAVAAYDTPNGCLLSPSVEAKKLGIKVGMRVKEAKLIYPNLVVLLTDPPKYRAVHLSLKKILEDYTPKVIAKSIDEFVLDFTGTPAFRRGLLTTAKEIKNTIQQEVGDYLTVSIGLAPNRFLAKTASNLHKPDGLDEINKDNYLTIYQSLDLGDLHGIADRNTLRLNLAGIYSVLDLLKANPLTLKSAFRSVLSQYWYARLRGWEVDDLEFNTKSFGHTYSLPKFLTKPEELAPVLAKLVEKMGFRMRSENFQARGVHLGILYQDYQYWHQGLSLYQPLFLSQDIYRVAYRLLTSQPYHLPVRNLSISCFNLFPRNTLQLELFQNQIRKSQLSEALDSINHRWGSFVVAPATMVGTQEAVPDRISFGSLPPQLTKDL